MSKTKQQQKVIEPARCSNIHLNPCQKSSQKGILCVCSKHKGSGCLLVGGKLRPWGVQNSSWTPATNVGLSNLTYLPQNPSHGLAFSKKPSHGNYRLLGFICRAGGDLHRLDQLSESHQPWKVQLLLIPAHNAETKA